MIKRYTIAEVREKAAIDHNNAVVQTRRQMVDLCNQRIAEERERIAQMVEGMHDVHQIGGMITRRIADAIRGRGE